MGPAQVMGGRLGAARRWALTEDRRGATSAARAALDARFEREVDPEGKLDPEERARRARFARRAFYIAVALRSRRKGRGKSRPGPAMMSAP